jgi:thiol:disulfide interchange protein DsbD
MILSGSPLDYLWAFLGGFFVSLTPCVYPLIPVTAGLIGVNAGVSKIRGVAFSLVYVTGIAITYSALGLFASLTGKIFGEVSSHPAAYFIVGVLIIIFGISMLDVFSLNLPSFLRLPEARSHSYISVFTLGLASGLIVGPCLTPVLGSILAYLITRKNIIYGMTLLFSFAYGMGFILIIVGIFSSILLGLPKLGRVMVYVKKISGVILITMGIYFIILGIRRI